MKRFIVSLALVTFSIQLHSQIATTSITILDSLVVFPTIPAISGNSVVFVDYRNFVYSLYRVDINTKQEQVAIHNIGYTEPQIRLFGDRVVWIGYPTVTQADVYVRDLLTNTTTRITADTAFQNFPDIYGNKVIWQDYRNTASTNIYNADIYCYDFSTGQTQQITTDTSYQTFPAIWENIVVWQDYRNASPENIYNADIYCYDFSTGQTKQITTDTSYQTFPAVWKNLIVWEDHRNGVGDIYMYDLITNTERPISTANGYKTHPVIYRDWIVWQDYRNDTTQGDIYGFNLATNQEYPIILQTDHQDFSQIDSLNLIWQDFRNNRQDIYHAILNNFTTGVSDDESLISGFTLRQNYPNPFNPATNIKFSLPVESEVTIKIFNLIGQEVSEVVNGNYAAGSHTVAIDGSSLSSGLYFYTINAVGADKKNFTSTKKMLLMK
jgi:beta propeller repeat protein